MQKIPVDETSSLIEIKASACTEQGSMRKFNEDAVFARTMVSDTGTAVGLYMVCDGVSGLQAGGVASRLAIKVVAAEMTNHLPILKAAPTNEVHDSSYGDLQEALRAAITTASTKLRNYAESHLFGAGSMGTTITLALIYGDQAYIANVGDSRTYLCRDQQLTQITEDHSWVNWLADQGIISEADKAHHPQRNVICRSLGHDDPVEVDMFVTELKPQDKLLLCSDGLWKAFGNDELLMAKLTAPIDPTQHCDYLIHQAKLLNGSDNISAVLINIQSKERENYNALRFP